MSYETYLHRSFDYQLSPTPSVVIDWTDTRRAHRTVMPSSSTGGAAAASPLVEVARQVPWRVKLTALEKAASLEMKRREQLRQQLAQGKLGGANAGAFGGSGTHGVGSYPNSNGQLTEAPRPRPGAASDGSNASMFYYVEDGNSKPGVKMGSATANGNTVGNGYLVNNGANGNPAAVNGRAPNQGHTARPGPGHGPAALVMYPVDGSLYAASSPEGEMLGLYSAGSPAPPLPPAANASANGEAVAASPSPQQPRQVLAPPHAATPSSSDASNGAIPPSAAPPAGGLAGLQDRLVEGVVRPAWSTLKDLVDGNGGGVDLAGNRSPLSPYSVVSLSDYACCSYGSLPLWRRGTFAVSAGVYAAFGFTHTERRQMRDLRRRRTDAAAADAPNGPRATGTSVDGYTDHNLGDEGMATALLGNLREDQQLQGEKARVLAGTPAAAAATAGAGPSPAHRHANRDAYLTTADVGTIDTTSALRVMNVVQLEWFWARRRWQGVFNVRLLPLAQHTRVPLCEYVMRTPWTEWSVQSADLVLNWSGFLTLYQQHAPALLLERERAFQETYGEAAAEEQAAAGSNNGGSGSGHKTPKEIVQALVDKKREEKQRQLAKEREGIKEKESEKEKKRKEASPSPASTRGSTPVDKSLASATTTVADADKKPTSNAVAPATSASVATVPQQGNHKHHGKAAAPETPPSDVTEVAPVAAAPTPPQPRRMSGDVHWWSLRHLKVGAGVSVKNDLATGINLYWGASGQMGRGLAFSGHIDVLRRMCCAVSSSLGPLDLSVRLRLNLITYHSTALDAGLCYRPFTRWPSTTLRLSTSATGRCVGVQVDDVTHEFFSGWIASHAAQRMARQLAEQQRSIEEAVAQHSGAKAAATTKAPTVPATAPSTSPSPTSTSPSGGVEAGSQNAEGGWISFGLITSAWGYLRGNGSSGHGTAQEEQARLALLQQQEEAAATAAAAAAAEASMVRAMGTRAMHFARTAPRRLLHMPRQWYDAVSDKVKLPPHLVDGAAATARTVTRVSQHTWREVRRLDWLEAMLDGAHVDVSFGVTHDPGRPGDGFRTFLVVNAH